MKILAHTDLVFNSKNATSAQFEVSFTWMLEDGTLSGKSSKLLQYPQSLTLNNLNDLIVNAIIIDINASGKYTIAKGDQVLLMNGFTDIKVVHPTGH